LTSDEWGNAYFAERIDGYKLGIIKLDPRGNTAWRTEYVFSSDLIINHVYDFKSDCLGNVYISLVNCGDNETYYYFLKFDKYGIFEWNRSQYVTRILVDAKGNVYTANENATITKYAPQGEISWNFESEHRFDCYLADVTIDRTGNVYLAPQKGSGGYWDRSYWSYLSLMKLVQTEQDYIGTTDSDKLKLDQNFPNPFNQQTLFRYMIPAAGEVLLTLYNNLGQEVYRQSLGPKGKGVHDYHFDGGFLASGIYYYSIKSNHFQQVKRMILIR